MNFNFDINKFDPNENITIEASAGTGKTYSVTEIIKKIVIEGNPDLLRRILIVTYTVKATEELKSRIRKALKDKYNKTYEDEVFNIYTIHSFCQKMIEEFGLYARIPLGLNVIDDEKSQMNEFAQDYIRKRGLTEYSVDKIVEMCSKYYLNSNFEEDKSIVALKTSSDDIEDGFNGAILDFYKEWTLEKLKNRNMAFSDMIRIVRENVLSNPDFLNRIKEKYTYAIIDEFQDTNQLQWDIFKNIFVSEGHHIYVVGDPKQSIYSFQGADVNVYLKAKEEINSTKYLTTNWRSSANVVNANNVFFRNVFEHFNESECCNRGIEAKFDGKELEGMWIYNCDKDHDDEKQFADFVIKKIVECCTRANDNETRLRVKEKDSQEFRNVTFKDFMILSRNRYEANEIKRCLTSVGIPFLAYKDNSLFTGREAAHWMSLLEAIDCNDFTGANRGYFRCAMFTDFFGYYDLSEINTKYFESDDIDEMILFKKWRKLADQQKWEALIDNILDESHIIDRLNGLDKLSRLSNYKQLASYSIAYLTSNHNITELINNLNSMKLSIGENDSLTGIISTDMDAVKLMTIHAAKGLQFPIVISTSGYKGAQSVYEGAGYVYTNDIRELCKTGDIDEIVEEWKRCIYVSYTRAIFLNIVPSYKLKLKPKDVINKAGFNLFNNFKRTDNKLFKSFEYKDAYYNKAKLKDTVETIARIINDESAAAKYNQIAKLEKIVNQLPNKKSYKHAYSSLSHSTAIDNIELLDNEDISNKEGIEVLDLNPYDSNAIQAPGLYDKSVSTLIAPNDFPKGSEIGSALHEIFEKATFTSYAANSFNSNASELESLIIGCVKKYRLREINKEGIKYIKDIVYNTLNAELPSLNESPKHLCDIPNDDKKSEVEFNYNKDNELFKNYFNGFIDLIFRANNRYFILDWKSDSLNDDDLISYADSKSLKLHTDNHYSIQRVLYSYSLIKWLSELYNEDPMEVFNNRFGGVYYVYIRGCVENTSNGIYAQGWKSYKALEEAYNKILKDKIGG